MELIRMCRPVLQLACCALITVASVPNAFAQTVVPATRSDTRGLVFGAHLLGNKLASARTRFDNDLSSGAMIGYGITRRIMLYAGIDAGSGSAVSYESPIDFEADPLLLPPGTSVRHGVTKIQPFLTGRTSVLHVDLGARYSYSVPTRAWIPFVDLAATNRRVATQASGGVIRSSGTATTIGTGMQYFVDSRFALEGAVRFSTGKYNRQENSGIKTTYDNVYKTETTRITGGVKYYPHIGRQ